MTRVVLYIFLAIILISLLRTVIGIIGKMIAAAVEPPPKGAPKPGTESGGELKRDPVCGVFVSPSASIKKTVAGQTLHFCSAGCRDKYPPKA